MSMPSMIPRAAVIIALTVCLGGCGTANNDAPSFDTSGNHPAGWVAFNGGDHRLVFRANPDQCQRCHGSDILVPGGGGGIARVGCSRTSFNGIICHANGHAPRLAPHALPFTNPALHGPAAKSDLVFCQGCHASSTGGPGSNPRFNAKIGALINGCEDCHNANTAHPSTPPPDNAPWRGPVTHRDAQNLANACALCHGATLAGGTGPACSSCHTAGSPLTALNCTSCHGNPPSGTVAPNIQGAHGTHDVLNNVTGACSTCHNGAGIGTLNHFNQVVNVSVSATYNAKSGAASFDPATLTCTNVSCHGGQTTPNWQTSTINVDTDCRFCHRSRVQEPPDQFNSFFSGKHDFHVFTVGLFCTQCHDTTKLAVSHFVGLNTPAFEGVPAVTIRDVVHYVGGSCTPDNTAGNFAIGCHLVPPLTRSWTAP